MRIVQVTISLTLALWAGVGIGAETDTHTLDIKAQPIKLALRDLGEQTGIQIVFRAEDVATHAVTTPRVSGRLSPQAALKQILQSAPGLQYEWVNPHTVMISARTRDPEQAAVLSEQLKLVRNDTQPIAERNEPVAPARPAESAAEQDQNIKGVPEILVRGKRTLNTDIRRSEDDVQPYVVFDAETIDRSMATSVEGFLKTRLPMNMIQGTNSQQPQGAGNVSMIDLRGLGTDETLILVNGRRIPGVAALNRGGAIDQPDINGIPLSAIERIEVLPSTASGIYGGGATGGVVNIVLKSNYNTMEFGATYDNTFDTDSGARRMDVVAGFNLESGRTNVMVTGSYSDGNALTVGDRNFVNRAYDLYLQNTGEDFSSDFRPPLASTANIRLAFDYIDPFNPQLRLRDPNGGPSIPLGERIAHVPIGYAGIDSDNGAGLIAAAGSYNLALPVDVQGLQASIVNSPTVSSLGLSIRREFTERIEGFIDISWRDNEGHAQYAAQNTSFDLAPFPSNPFDSFVTVSFPLPGLEFDTVFTSESLSANGGFIVRLPREWIGQIEYSHGRSENAGVGTSPIIGPDGLSALESGELDIFRDLNAFPPDYTGYLLDSPNSIRGPFLNTSKGATLRLAGPAYELPGGPLALSFFYEHRESQADAGFMVTQSAFTGDFSRLYYADRSDEIDSVSLEFNAPVFSRANARPGLHALELQFSARYDDYQVNGVENGGVLVAPGEVPPQLARAILNFDSSDYTMGFRYAPSPDVALRASFGTGFLPPNVAQITPTEVVGNLFARDPQRGNTSLTQNVTQIRGGNPTLNPEESESLSAGVILTPRFLPGVRLSVDFTEIRKVGEIARIQPNTILNNEELYAGRIERGELSELDMLLGYTAGPITMIDISMINLARTTVRALDAQLDYTFDTALGSVRAYAMATYLRDHISQVDSTVDPLNNAGHQYWLKWRGNTGVTLERAHWSVDWNMQYYHSYLLYPAGVPEAAIQFFTAEQGSESIGTQNYHDITARFNLGEMFGAGSGLLEGTDLQVGVANVFNTSPPILATASPAGGYSFLGDPRLRRYSISLRKRFH